MNYQLLTDATADMCPEMLEGLAPVEVIPMEVSLDGVPRTFGPGGDLTVEEFYAALREGKQCSTSQISLLTYMEAFERHLREGRDILYLCFTSGLSGTLQTALICMEELRERYPERTLRCVDTLCASVGEGFLVREAARKQTEGLPLEELAQWAEGCRLEVCHWFTVDTFEHLRRGGRVSAAAAAVGTALQIKPLLHVDEQGRLQVTDKPRGRRRAVQAQLAHMASGWTPERGRLVVIGHGDCPEDAAQLRNAVLERYPDAEVSLAPSGPIIGAHTGPGMLALIFWGGER